MKLKHAFPVLVATLATLALASTAEADTHHLSGTFRADPDATISMDVVISHGVPVSARNIEFAGLDYVCDGTGETGQADGDLGRASIFESARGGYEFNAEPAGTGFDGVIAGGLLGRHATKVKGGVVFVFQNDAGATCQSIFDGRYVAR